MKNDLTCGVVRDLLPSYVEGLLGEESREAVDRHLAGCPECTTRKDAMSAPTAEPAAETEKEVDFLKRLKKRGVKRVVLAVLCTALVLVGALMLKEYVIGRTPNPDVIRIDLAQVDSENNLTFLADTYSGNYELRGLQSTTEEGVVRYTAREVRTNAFQSSGAEGSAQQMSVPLKGVTEVWVCGRLVWQDGVVISKDCLDLLALRTPYCGDAVALEKIAQALNLKDRVGNYTTELKTNSRPYRWSLIFDNKADASHLYYMVRCEYLILALVDNLDSVVFTHELTMWSDTEYAEDGEEIQYTGGTTGNEMTLASANKGVGYLTEAYNQAYKTEWKAKTSVKDYVHSPADFQRLMNILDYHLESQDYSLTTYYLD